MKPPKMISKRIARGPMSPHPCLKPASGAVTLLWKVVVAVALSSGPAVRAADVTIKAEYNARASTSWQVQFQDTTPQSPICTTASSMCQRRKFTDFPLGTVNYRDMRPDAPREEWLYFRFPSAFREVPVVDSLSGRRAVVKFRVTSYVGRYRTAAPHDYLQFWEYLPFGTAALGPCNLLVGSMNPSDVMWIWDVPVESPQTSCAIKPKTTIPAGAFQIPDGHGVGYELVTPDPRSMRNGTYVGKLDYTIGPGGDFDFGLSALPSRSRIEVAFELKVRADLYVLMADGNRRAVLEPPMGWTAWAAGGAAPQQLRRDLGFEIFVGTPFTVTLSCASAVGDRCTLANGANSRVPYSVLMTIPGVYNFPAAEPVERMELLVNQPMLMRMFSGYMSNIRSKLHVEARKDSVDEMLKHPGSKYNDVFTLTFNAAL